MEKRMSDLHFRGMSVLFFFRDRIRPRGHILEEAGIGEGQRVLDYGCGTGSYSVLAAKAVGESGEVYALDIHPLSMEAVEKKASDNDITNIRSILSDCPTGLPDRSIDTVLLYDIFHMLDHREDVLKELHRVLKPQGLLSFSDHHMKEGDIKSGVTGGGLFDLEKKGRYTYSFRPAG